MQCRARKLEHACRHEGRTCFVSELAPHGDMFDLLFLRSEELGSDRTKHVLRQLSDALSHLHDSLHMVHADVKLENVLVRSLSPIQVRALEGTRERRRTCVGMRFARARVFVSASAARARACVRAVLVRVFAGACVCLSAFLSVCV